MICSKCGRELSPGATFCGNCGAPIQAAKDSQKTVRSAPLSTGKKPKKKLLWISLAALAAVVALFLALVCPHRNRLSATCTAPETCRRCGKTFGDALGHEWTPASCTVPKTCSRCKVQQGELLPHTSGEWEPLPPDPINAQQPQIRRCTACGQELERETQGLKDLYDADGFLFSPNQFIQRAANISRELEQSALFYSPALDFELYDKSPDHCVWKIYEGSAPYDYLGFVEFISNGTPTPRSQIDKSGVDQINFYLYNGDETVLSVLGTIFCTCDPTLDEVQIPVLFALAFTPGGNSRIPIISGNHSGSRTMICDVSPMEDNGRHACVYFLD